MVMDHAIIVRNAKKQYAKGTSILNGLNLTVPKGSIYGLLGPSGCGKTTLLCCVVGIRKLDSGEIWVLGGKPGTKNSGIPGPGVGYMPQDISLVEEFSVIGALYYFGMINGLDNYTIESKYLFLKDLLHLPPRDRLVRSMSGGQQRRLSFACALLHEPELLILDEPTVGLDPVLRDNIWNYLVKITQNDGVTVIITTHYIEEAKQASTIGLMRSGQLLAESSPNNLLEKYQTESLEEAFLKLSQQQAQNSSQTISPLSVIPTELNNIVTLESAYKNFSKQNEVQPQSSTAKRCQALLMKNGLQFIRHPGGVLFSIVLPIVQVMLFLYSTGPDPKGFSISIVNEEAGNCAYGKNWGNVTFNENEFTCNFVDLSCRFIDGIDGSVLKKVYYDSYNDAVREITKQKSVAIMHFHRNFSDAFYERLEDYLSISEGNVAASQIEVIMQTADLQVELFAKKNLFKNFMNAYEDIMQKCRIPKKFAHIPIHFEDPIFGKKDPNYVTFVSPPFVLSLVFILATSICSSIIITDRRSGVWDRSLVQGVRTPEILATHLMTQLIVIVIQVALALCIWFFYFGVECKGSMYIVIVLTMFGGICGMLYGFTISILCKSHTLVNMASVGSFYPLILLCGIIWPIEGMPKLLRWFSLGLPLTIPGISLRGVLEKGSSMNEPEVYNGFLVLTVWILGFILLCLFQLRSKIT